jgi:uncharacterized protein YyaL (SSP411 family)
MNSRIFLSTAAVVTTLCCLVLGTGGCRKGDDSLTKNDPPVAIAPEFSTNALGLLPGAIHRSQTGSPVHWQPWTKETIARAKASNRLIFAVIAMPQQPGFQTVLAGLAKDTNLVATIHEHYVPVLIDGDASREVGLLTADLCAEIKRGVQLPLFLWMTPDGNPVAWTPVNKSAAAKVGDIFNQSHLVVSQTWADDIRNHKSYVLNNSALDNDNRRQRMSKRYESTVMSEKPGEDAVRSLRQLTSFYDPYSRSFDEAGGLFPAGSIDLLATAAIHPGLPPEVRSRCMETTRELLVDLLPSAMFDPLEGGVFSSRRGNSWSLPTFQRDCVAQARAAVALIHAYRATGNVRALSRALELIAFSEKAFATTEGLFSMGLADESDAAAWLWSVEEIEKELPPEDATWWIKSTGMKGLGNLPSEADPRREFFRGNSLGLDKSPAQLAVELGQAPEAFAQRFETTRKRLLKARSNRLGPVVRDDCSHAGATLRMVSAYAAAFGVTGDVKFRDKASALLDKSRLAFGDGPNLRLFSKGSPKSIGEGRAFLYALALQAALDVSVITTDEKWLLWCEDLASTATELFTGGGILKECSDDAKIIDLPVTDRVMLFDDSTAGLIAFAECRLADRERPLVAAFSNLATPLPLYSVERPILHTDLLQATLAREFRISVVSGPGISPELKLAIEQLPLRMIQRRAAKPKDEIPAGSVMVIAPKAEPRLVSSPEALREAVLPSP